MGTTKDTCRECGFLSVSLNDEGVCEPCVEWLERRIEFTEDTNCLDNLLAAVVERAATDLTVDNRVKGQARVFCNVEVNGQRHRAKVCADEYLSYVRDHAYSVDGDTDAVFALVEKIAIGGVTA